MTISRTGDLGAKPPKEKGKKRRGPKPATPERLEKAALSYLERFATSAENLRRVLGRRVHRSAQLHGTDEEAGLAHIDALIERYIRAGLLDDAAFARAKVHTLTRAGHARRAIRMRLRAKGVAPGAIDKALEELAEEMSEADPDIIAALRYARRRRLGPFGAGDETRRQREMAALARRGFSLDIVRLIMDARDEVELADRLSDRGVDLGAI
ncbi:MAG: regulatory protein RecX [Pseudomonadota bacterium]